MYISFTDCAGERVLSPLFREVLELKSKSVFKICLYFAFMSVVM